MEAQLFLVKFTGNNKFQIFCFFMKAKTILFFFLLISITCFSQDPLKSNHQQNRKGTFFMYWGYNWDWYSKSDIHFEGEDYDFELKNVIAKDKQTDFSFDRYFNLGNISLPQYNLRIGYFFNNHYSVSLGIDHMKYVVLQGQTTQITGSIQNSGTIHDGVYNNESIVIEEGFLEFEHTDGLNYINTEIRRFDEVHYFNENIQLNLLAGAGIGAIYPKTNTTLLNKERYDEFNLAGYGAHALLGINFTFFKHFFVQTEFKGGYINMPNIRTTQFKADSADQQFFFAQYNFNFGASFNFFEMNKKSETL